MYAFGQYSSSAPAQKTTSIIIPQSLCKLVYEFVFFIKKRIHFLHQMCYHHFSKVQIIFALCSLFLYEKGKDV